MSAASDSLHPSATATVPAGAALPAVSAVGFPAFDWLRILLATTVVIYHAHLITWPNAGDLAVQVFFTLSGWLIGGILLDTNPRGLARFWFNRATRIWIPYAVALALFLALSLYRDAITPKWIEFVFYKLTFTYNLFGPPQLSIVDQMPLKGSGHHFWSICAEEQFYLLAPLLLVLAPRRLGRSLLLWAGIAAAAIVFDGYGSITLGVLAALLHRRFGEWYRSPWAIGGLVVMGVAAATGMAANALPYHYLAPPFAVAVVLLLARAGRRSPVGEFLGGMSYPLYLNHWIGVFSERWLLKRAGLADSLVGKALGVALALGFAAALYVLIDRQILARRSGWFGQRRGWTLAAVGFGLVAVGLTGGLFLRARG